MVSQAANCAGCGANVPLGSTLCGRCQGDLSGIMYAGFWTRFLASFIDGIVLLIPNIFIGAVVPWPTGSLIQLAIGLVYTIGFWVSEGATPGKMAMGVVILKVNGEPLDAGSAFLRYIGYIVSTITLGIGYLMIAFRGDKRALHDLMADTVVLKKTHLEQYIRSLSEIQPTG
ncbi:MAG: RDD family protein [Dehalococcoidia bacterium]